MSIANFVNEKRPVFMQKIVSAGERHQSFYCPIYEEGENGQKLTLQGMEVPNSSDEAWLTFASDERNLLQDLGDLVGMLSEWSACPDPESGAVLYKREGMPIKLGFDTDAEKPSVVMIYTNTQPGQRFNNRGYQLAASLLFDEMAELFGRTE